VAYDGYFTFGGTELINAERTRAYVRHALPTFGIGEECCPCEDLAAVLGDAPYSSPLADAAPWFSPYEPSSGDFYGLLPLSVEGIDNGTMTAAVSELTTDGAVISRPRRGSRTIRFSVLMLGGTDKALDAGMGWLKSVLRGSDCSDCGGDELCYLAACPPVCDYSDFPVEVLDVTGSEVIDPANVALWLAGTGSFLTPLAGPPPAMAVTNTSGAPSASIVLRDLIPGANYRVNLDLVFAQRTEPIVVDLPGAVGDEFKIWWSVQGATTDVNPPADGGTGVFEFTATTEVQRLVITAPSTLTQFLVRGYQVTRIGDRAVAMTSQTRSGIDQVNSWSGTVIVSGGPPPTPLPLPLPGSPPPPPPPVVVPTAITYPGEPYGEARFVRGWNSTGTVIPADVPDMYRQLTGLTPGKRYKVRVAARHKTGTTTNRGLVVSVDSLASTSPTFTYLGGAIGAYAGWAELEFVATAVSHVLRVRLANPYTSTTASGETYVQVDYVRVEALDDAPLLDPDPARGYRRHMRNVIAVSGPTVTAEFAPTVGAMRQVEFVLVAGDPRPLGDSIDVAGPLNLGIYSVVEQACSNGEPVLTNYITNPSFEVDNSLWNQGANGSAVVAITTPTTTAASGTKALHMQVTTAGTGSMYISTWPDVSAPVGATYTLSGHVRSNVTVTARAYAVLDVAAGARQWFPPETVAVLPAGSGWRRLANTFTLQQDAGIDQVFLRVDRTDGAPWAVGDWVEFDAIMLVDGARVGPYFDGSTRYGTWNGTAGLSTSTYKNVGSPLVFDPDCPPTPTPPRPPVIPGTCFEAPPTWYRYTTRVPASLTAMSPWSLPAVSITSSQWQVTAVRVRWVPNPLGLPHDQLDPCSYCGEFIVTYMPPWSTLTVDAADRTARISVNGAEPVSALNLLQGADGAPITWPELTCGVEYVAYIDVDQLLAFPIAGVDVSVTPAY